MAPLRDCLWSGRHLDPNREASKKAMEHNKEIAKRLDQPLVNTNPYEHVIACDVINPDHMDVEFDSIQDVEVADLKKETNARLFYKLLIENVEELLFILLLLVTAVNNNYGEKVLIWLAAEQFKFTPVPVLFADEVCCGGLDCLIICSSTTKN